MKIPNYKDVRKFVNLENELSLFEHSYNGFYYWQSIRFYVCESLFGNRTKNMDAERRIKKKSICKIGFEICKSLFEGFRLAFHLNRHNHVDLVFFRGPISSDKFYDSWNLPDNITTESYRVVSSVNGRKSGDYFLDGARIKTAFKRKFFRKFKLNKTDIKEHNFLSFLEKKLIDEFGQALTVLQMETMIQDFIIQDKIYSKLYSKIFNYTQCKAIALVCYYTNEFFPAIRVAKERGITSIEFQHGVINNHEEYWFEDNRGVNNYLPDYLLTFGDIHNSWVRLVKGEKAISIGFPFQEKSVNLMKKIQTDEKEIIVYPESNPEMERVIDQFINKITTLGYHVYIKIHPLESQNIEIWYPLLSKNRNATIITSQKEGIYYWLKKGKHHIMASSTVGLETVVFDHSNICIATNVPHDQVQCLIDWGLARGFNTAEELETLILNPINISNSKVKDVRRQLWKENACANMTGFFNKIKANDWKL